MKERARVPQTEYFSWILSWCIQVRNFSLRKMLFCVQIWGIWHTCRLLVQSRPMTTPCTPFIRPTLTRAPCSNNIINNNNNNNRQSMVGKVPVNVIYYPMSFCYLSSYPGHAQSVSCCPDSRTKSTEITKNWPHSLCYGIAKSVHLGKQHQHQKHYLRHQERSEHESESFLCPLCVFPLLWPACYDFFIWKEDGFLHAKKM